VTEQRKSFPDMCPECKHQHWIYGMIRPGKERRIVCGDPTLISSCDKERCYCTNEWHKAYFDLENIA
jgi:hypothetical protein